MRRFPLEEVGEFSPSLTNHADRSHAGILPRTASRSEVCGVRRSSPRLLLPALVLLPWPLRSQQQKRRRQRPWRWQHQTLSSLPVICISYVNASWFGARTAGPRPATAYACRRPHSTRCSCPVTSSISGPSSEWGHPLLSGHRVHMTAAIGGVVTAAGPVVAAPVSCSTKKCYFILHNKHLHRT